MTPTLQYAVDIPAITYVNTIYGCQYTVNYSDKMEDDEDMKAPQISDCIEVLSSDHGWNGTAVESEGALALLDKLFALLDPIKPMGTDDNKRIWIWADRGSADDSWDYEDMLASGEVKNRREFESLFLEFYPHETYWFPLQIMNYRGFRAVFLMYDCILVHDAREDCPSQARHPWHGEDRGMLGFLVKAAERSFRMIEEGTYNDYVQRNLPFRNRYGAIPSRIYHQVYPAVMENILDGLTAAEINEFRAIVERGDYESNRIGRMNKMTSGTYFAAVWNCYEAIGGRFRTGLLVPMHFTSGGFESAWRMKEYADAAGVGFWSIGREGETLDVKFSVTGSHLFQSVF